jgi:non-canonical (house-cleaning) NTP pyrophosphatase
VKSKEQSSLSAAVGSTNPVKVAATQAVLHRIYGAVEVLLTMALARLLTPNYYETAAP